MLIISKQKDYYDGVVGTMGVDKTIVYERHTKEYIKRNEFPKEFCYDMTRGWKERSPELNVGITHLKEGIEKYKRVNWFIVGFCGKLYIGWKLWYREEDGLSGEWKYDISYDFDYVEPMIKISYMFHKPSDSVKKILNYNAINIFREHHTPSFIYYEDDGYRVSRNEKFIVNPILKDFEFYKVFDSFTAFQEIQMFLGGVLGSGENDMVEISNKNKILKHGFDYKWSFRKEPTKKK